MMWILAFILVLAVVIWAVFYERFSYRLRERHVVLPFPGPKRLTILHITDLHLIPRSRRLVSFLQSLASVEADLVVYTGDFLEDPNDAPLLREALSGISGRLGSFAVFGNHDHYRYVWTEIMGEFPHYPGRFRDTAEPQAVLQQMGVECLLNASRVVECDGFPLRIVGIDDPFVDKDDLDAAFAEVKKEDTAIVLVHTPGIYKQLVERGVALILSGHVHGGQVRLPLIGALVTRCSIPRRFALGFSRHGKTTLFASPGLGTSPKLPFRLFCPPEATLLQVTFGK
ncbi:MAG: metallophosphoesterase [bacterium]